MTYTRNPRQKKNDGIKRQMYRLPANLDPVEVDCVSLKIPDDPEYRELFLSAMWALTRWFYYERTGTDAGARVANLFKVAYDTITFGCADDEDEDTIADDIADFVNGIINNFQEGGIVSALGYVIQELGRIVVETVVRVVSTTVYAVGVAGIIYILINGVPVSSVGILPNEVIELIYDTGNNSSKIIEFIYEVAA